MRYFHMTKNQYHRPTLNVDQLWPIIPQEARETHAADKTKAPVIDCVAAGFSKVLGKGLLPNQPMIVKARFFSKRAEQKIKAAGGACVLV